MNIKLDKGLKEEARQVAKEIGLPLSNVVQSFLRQFVRDKEVTFSAKKYTMTPYLEGLVAEAHRDYENGDLVGPFSTHEELFASLDI